MLSLFCYIYQQHSDSFKPTSLFNMMSETVSSKLDPKEEIIDLTKISLREIDLSDLDDLMVWSSDEKVTKYCTWESYTSKEDGINLINKIPTMFSWYRAICLDNRAIGSISVCLYSGNDKCKAKTAEVGYILAAEYWGKGIITHVLKQVGKIIFCMYPELERLEALTDLENAASQRVLEKAGFQREGVLRKYMHIKGKSRDVVIYSLLPTDLQNEFDSVKL